MSECIRIQSFIFDYFRFFFTASYCTFLQLKNRIFFFIISFLRLYEIQKHFDVDFDLLHQIIMNVYLFDENENSLCLWIVIYAWFTSFSLCFFSSLRYLHMRWIKSKHLNKFFAYIILSVWNHTVWDTLEVLKVIAWRYIDLIWREIICI